MAVYINGKLVGSSYGENAPATQPVKPAPPTTGIDIKQTYSSPNKYSAQAGQSQVPQNNTIITTPPTIGVDVKGKGSDSARYSYPGGAAQSIAREQAQQTEVLTPGALTPEDINNWNTTGGYYVTPTGQMVSSPESPNYFKTPYVPPTPFKQAIQNSRLFGNTNTLFKYAVPENTPVFVGPVKVADANETNYLEANKRGKEIYEQARAEVGKQYILENYNNNNQLPPVEKAGVRSKEQIIQDVTALKLGGGITINSFEQILMPGFESRKQQFTETLNAESQKTINYLTTDFFTNIRKQRGYGEPTEQEKYALQVSGNFLNSISSIPTGIIQSPIARPSFLFGMQPVALKSKTMEAKIEDINKQISTLVNVATLGAGGVSKFIVLQAIESTSKTGVFNKPFNEARNYLQEMETNPPELKVDTGIGTIQLPKVVYSTGAIVAGVGLDIAQQFTESPKEFYLFGKVLTGTKIPYNKLLLGGGFGTQEYLSSQEKGYSLEKSLIRTATVTALPFIFGGDTSKQAGISGFAQEIAPITRSLRSLSPLKYFDLPERSEQIVSDIQYAKLLDRLKIEDYLRVSKSVTPESYIKSVRIKGFAEQIPRQIINEAALTTKKDISFKYGGSTISKNVYTFKKARAELDKGNISEELFKDTTQKNDIDLLKRNTEKMFSDVLPKNYEQFSPELKSTYRALIPEKEQLSYINIRNTGGNKINIPEEQVLLRPEYMETIKVLQEKQPNIIFKGSFGRNIRASDLYVGEKRISNEDYQNYFKTIQPKEINLPNGEKISVFKDIDLETMLGTNKSEATQLLENINANLKNKFELVNQKVSVGTPFLRFLNKETVTLQVRNLELEESKLQGYLQQNLGHINTRAYLSVGDNKTFDLLRLKDVSLESINKMLNYSPTDPNKLNINPVDIGSGNIFSRAKVSLGEHDEVYYQGKRVGAIQTQFKDLTDAMNVKVFGKRAKQEPYFTLSEKAGYLKPFEKGKQLNYEDNLQNAIATFYRRVQLRSLKSSGELLSDFTPNEPGLNIFSFGGQKHKLQILNEESFTLFPEFKDITFKGRRFVNPYGESPQEYLAAIQGLDESKLFKSAVNLQRFFDSSYFKHKNLLQKSNYSLAVKLLEKEVTPQSPIDYLFNRQKFFRVKYTSKVPERITLFGKEQVDELTGLPIRGTPQNPRVIKSNLFENVGEEAQRIAKSNELNKEVLEQYSINNTRFASRNKKMIAKILGEKNKEKQVLLVENFIKQNTLSKEELYKAYETYSNTNIKPKYYVGTRIDYPKQYTYNRENYDLNNYYNYPKANYESVPIKEYVDVYKSKDKKYPDPITITYPANYEPTNIDYPAQVYPKYVPSNYPKNIIPKYPSPIKYVEPPIQPPTKPITSNKQKEDEKKLKKFFKGFQAFVRKKGKFVKVSNEILPKGLAYERAAGAARSSLAQSITVKESGLTELQDNMNANLEDFRRKALKSKIPGEPVFVQRNPLASKTEVQQIQEAKKLKQQWRMK